MSIEKLNVPLKRQLPNSVECGLVELDMIYSYYGVKKSMEDLRQDLSMTEVGTYAPQTGLHLLRNGFSVEIVTHNPRLVWKEDKNLTPEELLAKFKEKYKIADENDKIALGYFIDFMKNGGKITVKIPSLKDLEEEIREGRPVMALITNAAIYDKNIAETHNRPFSYTFHGVVVVGVGHGKVIINDPYAEEDGGTKEYTEEEFMFAVHASCLGDLDNGCFIKVRKLTK